MRLGEGKRLGLFAFATLFLIFNLFGGIALGFGFSILNIVGAVIGMAITTSVTLVSGAAIYLAVLADSPIRNEHIGASKQRTKKKGKR